MDRNRRREVLKRLALVAAAGYVAPTLTRIDSTAVAGSRRGRGSRPGGSRPGGGCSAPPCN